VSDLDEVRVVRDGDDEALEGSNGKREGKDLSIRVALSGPEGVLEEYRIRPIPNEGSMTLGVNSRTV
jgi:hypothetical protein